MTREEAMRKVILFTAVFLFVLVLTSCNASEASTRNTTAILERIAGHWVDSALYDNPVISADLLWPLELFIYPQGIAPSGAWPLSAFIMGGTGMYYTVLQPGVRS